MALSLSAPFRKSDEKSPFEDPIFDNYLDMAHEKIFLRQNIPSHVPKKKYAAAVSSPLARTMRLARDSSDIFSPMASPISPLPMSPPPPSNVYRQFGSDKYITALALLYYMNREIPKYTHVWMAASNNDDDVSTQYYLDSSANRHEFVGSFSDLLKKIPTLLKLRPLRCLKPCSGIRVNLQD
jgi:hypothetical protein